MEARKVDLGRGTVQLQVGGEGPDVVLLHGGWGGAAMHWSPVWDRLAASGFRVWAPELPGVGQPEEPSLRSLLSYAAWLDELLSTLGVGSAAVVGNSLGAAVAWAFALRFPERCAALVMVNGGPFPGLPTPIREIARRQPTRWFIREALRWSAYRPAILPRAFHRLDRVPRTVQEVVALSAPPQLDSIAELFVTGLDFAVPRPPVLLVWGEEDRLPGGRLASAEALHRRVPGSTLRTIPQAGHLPQVEQPEAFVAEVTAFLRSLPR